MLSEKMLKYNPTNRVYPGDDCMWVATKQAKRVRKEMVKKVDRRCGRPNKRHTYEINITTRDIQMASTHRSGTPARLCTEIMQFNKHIESITRVNFSRVCEVCGEIYFSKCTVCGASMYVFEKKVNHKGKDCFARYHDPKYFGLCRSGSTLVGKSKREWKVPSANKVRNHARYIKGLLDGVYSDDGDE